MVTPSRPPTSASPDPYTRVRSTARAATPSGTVAVVAGCDMVRLLDWCVRANERKKVLRFTLGGSPKEASTGFSLTRPWGHPGGMALDRGLSPDPPTVDGRATP